MALTRKWFEVKIFISNHFWTHAQREREREPSPQTKLQSDDHKSSRSHRAVQGKIALCWLQHCALLSSFFSQFDRIWWIFFFLSFVSFVFLYWGMILYICLAAEKMWATSSKCVFYSIFKNTTKHQKMFFKTFFEIQLNTWKYFPFPKIAFLKNILHESNTALDFFFFFGGGGGIYRLWGGVGKGKPNQILKATSAYSTD